MVLTVLFLWLGAPFWAEAADPIPYYGDRFYKESGYMSVDSPIKSLLREILQSDHRRRPGQNDEILSSCSGNGCYRHTSIGYKRARIFLFGEFYLVRDGGAYGVKEMYCQRVYGPDEFRSTKPGPGVIPDSTVVNAEHTWPQSRFSRKYSAEMQKSDLHHLYPTDSHLNSSRSSLPFGDVSGRDKPLECDESRLGQGSRGEGIVFEPPPAHKGNVARSLFYFSVKYDLPIRDEEEATLRAWHVQDPVDQEEKRRNEEVFKLQGSRNPFVDFPELVSQVRDF